MVNLNGKELALSLHETIKTEVTKLIEQTNITPCVCVVVVGNDESSAVYVKNKIIACKKVGIQLVLKQLPEETTQEELNLVIDELSTNSSVHGILLQLPVPKHINPRIAISHIAPSKDVDGLTNENLGKLTTNEPDLLLTACTAKGIIALLDNYNISLSGKHCVIVGRSLLVGKPLMQLLLSRDAFVTILHSKTPDIKPYTKQADILISAVGKKDLITKSHVKKGAVVIDVAIVKVDGKLYGDVMFDEVSKVASHISPVPGGIGPLTVAMLLQNTLLAYKQQLNLNN